MNERPLCTTLLKLATWCAGDPGHTCDCKILPRVPARLDSSFLSSFSLISTAVSSWFCNATTLQQQQERKREITRKIERRLLCQAFQQTSRKGANNVRDLINQSTEVQMEKPQQR